MADRGGAGALMPMRVWPGRPIRLEPLGMAWG